MSGFEGRSPAGNTRRFLRRLTLIAAVLLLALGATAAMWVASLPSPSGLVTANPASTAFIDRYRERRAADPSLPELRWTWVLDEDISVHMKRAAVSAEDMEFFFHDGFSTAEISAAVREAVAERRAPRGASTITQQLAKNLWLSPSRSLTRKFAEVILTRRLERALTKSRILDMYLNVAEFGPGIYGVEAAAQTYFYHSASVLTERESAMLAASLPRPSRWHPGVGSEAYHRYVDEILARMARAEFLWKYVGPP